MTNDKFECIEGRTITRNGIPFVSLVACRNPVTEAPNFPYAEANDFANEIAEAFNSGEVRTLLLNNVKLRQLREALQQLIDRLDYHGSIDPIREEGPIADATAALRKE